MKKLILRSDYPAGDTVVLTGAVRDLHQCYPGQFLTDVRTACKALWDNNPYLTPLDEIDPSVRVIDCKYPLIAQSNRKPYHSQFGFIDFLNELLGLNIQPTAAHGDMHLGALERRWMPQVMQKIGKDVPYWIVVSGGKYDYSIKWWDAQRWQEVVDHFRGRILFVQVGKSSHYHPELKGVLDLRAKTDLRQLVRLVYHSQGVACPVTSLMHLAAAVQTPSGRPKNRACVVVAGGREPMQWEAYTHHQFIHTNGQLLCCDQGGCWKSRTVPLGDGAESDQAENLCVQPVVVRSKPEDGQENLPRHLPRCMDMIKASDVIRRIEGYFTGGALEYLTPDEAKLASPHLSADWRAQSKTAARLSTIIVEPDLAVMPWHEASTTRRDDLSTHESVFDIRCSRGSAFFLRHLRTHTPRLGPALLGVNGRNWLLASVPGLIFDSITMDGLPSGITFRTDGGTAAFRYSKGKYVRRTGAQLNLRLEQGKCVVQSKKGGAWHFEVSVSDGDYSGRFAKATFDGGRSVNATYDAMGRLLAQVETGGSRSENLAINYDYFLDGDHCGLLKGAELKLGTGVKSKPMVRATFCYYEGRSIGGAVNDLKSATNWRFDAATSKWAPVGTCYYRYYLKNASPGFAAAIKLLLEPDAVARLRQNGADIDRLSDDDLMPAASFYREYDHKGRVTLETQPASREWRRWTYLESDGADDRNWDIKITETASNGPEHTTYFDKDELIARRDGEENCAALRVLSSRMRRALNLQNGNRGSENVREPRHRAENLTAPESGSAAATGVSAGRKSGARRLSPHYTA